MIDLFKFYIRCFTFALLLSFTAVSSAISQQNEIPQLIKTSNLRLIQPIELTKSETFRSTIDIDLKIVQQILDNGVRKFLVPGIQTVSDTVSITRIMHHPVGYSILGYLNGSKQDSFTLSFANGRFLSHINRANIHSRQHIRYAKGIGSHILVDVDTSELDILLCFAENHQHSKFENPPVEKNQVITTPETIQSASEIDVMIVYTPASVDWLIENELDIQTVMNESMARSQLAFDNSEVQITINLVHTMQVDYEETGSIASDLENLTFGKIGGVIRSRDLYGADLVSMFTKEDRSGGSAWYMSSSFGDNNFGYSIVRVQQASFSTTQVHEIGHNLGSAHSRNQSEEAASSGLLNEYSTGWRWIGEDSLTYVSVMTYINPNDSDPGRPVDFFSNPEITYMGVATGSYTGEFAPADNARSLNEMRGIIANYKTRGTFVDESLCESVGNCDMSFTTDENSPWLPQSQIVHSGSSSPQSYDISNSQSTGFETTITGPGTLSFYWKVSSEKDYDFLQLKENDSVIKKISGFTEWEFVTQMVPEGNHTYSWIYTKDSNASAGLDLGWVDSIVFGSSTSVEEDEEAPNRIELYQNYPNPFNPTTLIRFSLPQSTYVKLEVFSTLGQRVATLIDGPTAGGYHAISFDGQGLAGGIYHYRLTTPESSVSRIMNIIK